MTVHSDLAAACADVREADKGDGVDGVQPDWVASPTSTDEAAALLRAAAGHGLGIVARGNGTKLTWGSPPQRADLVVDMSRMNQLLEHAAGDLVVVAQAGLPLAALQEQLSTAGQQLALDETVPGSTVGGIVATSPSGPHRMTTGTVRDLLIGVTLVRADGVVAKSGGKVVKNVAGYDLGKLVIGSYGTLGLVTQATFRLHPLPAASRWVQMATDDLGTLTERAAAVLHSQTVPAALEVDWPVEGPGTVAVLVEGTSAGVDSRTTAVAELLGPDAEVADGGPPWGETYPWAGGDTGQVALKLGCQLSGVPDVLAAARAAGVAIRGSAGVGVLYGALPAGTSPETVAGALDRLREVCTRQRGSVVVIDAPAGVKAAVDVWGPVHGLELMQRVKDQFDPDHRLAPGRFVGGI